MCLSPPPPPRNKKLHFGNFQMNPDKHRVPWVPSLSCRQPASQSLHCSGNRQDKLKGPHLFPEVKRFIFCNVTSQDSGRNSEQGVSSGFSKVLPRAAPRSKALLLSLPTLSFPELSPSPLYSIRPHSQLRELQSPGQWSPGEIKTNVSPSQKQNMTL